MNKVLIIDDAKPLLNIMQLRLKNDFKVITSLSSVDGIKMIVKENPDVLVIDLMMPQINGIQILQSLKNKNNYVPVIVLTSAKHSPMVDEAYALGAKKVLFKPCNFSDLISTIKIVIEESVITGDELAELENLVKEILLQEKGEN